MISVYYDGKCGLCSREIGYFKKRPSKQAIVWHDIASDPSALAGTGLCQADALLYLRVRDGAGDLKTGVDAFIVLWSQFAGWSVLARLVSLPGTYSFTSWLYRHFAHRRFNRYPHCRVSMGAEESAGRM